MLQMLILAKVELNSLQSISNDSTKLLTEKLALSRELSTLKPEVEHLRSQAASYQMLLTEKLSLQRQLNTTQVELETERRATQRALTRERGRQAQDAKLASELENLQAELAKERRERQKAERDVQKTLSEVEGKNTVLESRLDAFRNKLRITKEQLKDAQAELQSTQGAGKARPDPPGTAGLGKKDCKGPEKRNIAQLDADATIGTPGILPAAKKSKRGSTLPGDKSTFSITPFLNRTASLAPESPQDMPTAAEDQEDADASDDLREKIVSRYPPSHQTSVTKAHVGTLKEKAPINPRNIAAITKAGKIKVKAPPGRKVKSRCALEQVDEEINDEKVSSFDHQELLPKALPSKALADRIDVNDTLNEEGDVKKRKRKLLGVALGRTLFDDDDGEMAKGGDGGIFGAVKGFGTLGRSGLPGSKFGSRIGLGGSAQGFGAFSPLKKDRNSGVA